MTKKEFVEHVLKAHKTVVTDAWDKWDEMIREEVEPKKGKKRPSETKYPDGFKDFLMEFLDDLIKDNEQEAVE